MCGDAGLNPDKVERCCLAKIKIEDSFIAKDKYRVGYLSDSNSNIKNMVLSI